VLLGTWIDSCVLLGVWADPCVLLSLWHSNNCCLLYLRVILEGCLYGR
jgi:hypothetical protein